MRKKILALSLALALALSLTPALAADTAGKFPAKNAWTGFADVADNHWALSSIKICYETDLMKGKGKGFDPAGTVTAAEAMAVAARVGATLRGDSIPASTDGTWYGGSVAYLKGLPRGNEITSTEGLDQKYVTRYGICLYLSIAVPEDALAVKNNITSLPDTDDADVLRLYSAGVLKGLNDYGTFSGEKGLSRAEMAAMISRVAKPDTALSFAPKVRNDHDPDFDPLAYYTGVAGSTAAITGKDNTITMTDYLTYYMTAVNELVALCDEQGIPFSWNLSVGDTPLPDNAKSTATSNCLYDLWVAKYGGGQFDAATALGAKHILVETKEEADSLRAQLKAAGDSTAKFDELMNKYSKDGRDAQGNLGAPDGYTFGPGYMVAEFEVGTKALTIGQISEPIQSQHGWHIILRTEPDPAALTEMTDEAWLTEQNFQYSEMLLNIDLPSFYNNYTSGLSK